MTTGTDEKMAGAHQSRAILGVSHTQRADVGHIGRRGTEPVEITALGQPTDRPAPSRRASVQRMQECLEGHVQIGNDSGRIVCVGDDQLDVDTLI